MYKIIIYGQRSTGITPTAAELKEFYGCEHIIENWDATQPLKPGTLAITSARPPFNAEHGSPAISIDIAADHINKTRTKICKGRDGCNQIKPLHEFYRKGNTHDGHDNICAVCMQARNKRKRDAETAEEQDENARTRMIQNILQSRRFC